MPLIDNIDIYDPHFLSKLTRPPSPAMRPPVVSPIRSAFSDLLVALADNHPIAIIGNLDARDLEERAEHVQRLLGAVETYLKAVLADAKHRTSGIKFDVNVMGILSDTRGDLVDTFSIAAEKMREMKIEEFECE